MDEFGWVVVGSLAGVAGVVVVATFGVIPLVQERRRARRRGGAGDPAEHPVVLFPAPLLAVPVRGRDKVINRLAGLAAPPGQVQVLAGLGGSGKSAVALAVAARAGGQGRRVWWVPVTDAVSLGQQLLGLAGGLGASLGEVQEALAGRLNPADVLWRRLEASRSWVLVLDNADDLAALASGDRPAQSGTGWLRPTRSGLVLVTSRVSDKELWGPATQVEMLEPLADADGALVLADLAPHAGEAAEAAELSGALGGLPLALHQAGSYLASPFAAERSFGEYHRALAQRFADLMGRGSGDREKVTATWELSLTALAAQGRGQARADHRSGRSRRGAAWGESAPAGRPDDPVPGGRGPGRGDGGGGAAARRGVRPARPRPAGARR